MDTRGVNASAMAGSLAALAVLLGTTVSTHHSFAMYDQKKVVTLTGVVKQFVPQANHAEIHFYPLAPDHKSVAKSADGKNVEWGIEMAGAAQLERQGISPRTFGEGTVFSVHLNPLRDGQVPGGPGDQEDQASRAGQALRFSARTHAKRGSFVLVLHFA
jgi:hypothetical protein